LSVLQAMFRPQLPNFVSSLPYGMLCSTHFILLFSVCTFPIYGLFAQSPLRLSLRASRFKTILLKRHLVLSPIMAKHPATSRSFPAGEATCYCCRRTKLFCAPMTAIQRDSKSSRAQFATSFLASNPHVSCMVSSRFEGSAAIS
jgi:hypothetical protein